MSPTTSDSDDPGDPDGVDVMDVPRSWRRVLPEHATRRRSDATEPLAVPIGHDLGPLDPPGPQHSRGQVRVAAGLFELSGPEYEVWLAAHGAMDASGAVVAATWPARHEVESGQHTTPDRRRAAGMLVRRGLLHRVSVTAPATVEFAARHRLQALAHGLERLDEDRYVAGLPGQALVTVEASVGRVWRHSLDAPDLWTACRLAAPECTGAGGGRDRGPKPMLAGFLRGLHVLLATRTACLDALPIAVPVGAVRVGGGHR